MYILFYFSFINELMKMSLSLVFIRVNESSLAFLNTLILSFFLAFYLTLSLYIYVFYIMEYLLCFCPLYRFLCMFLFSCNLFLIPF